MSALTDRDLDRANELFRRHMQMWSASTDDKRTRLEAGRCAMLEAIRGAFPNESIRIMSHVPLPPPSTIISVSDLAEKAAKEWGRDLAAAYADETMRITAADCATLVNYFRFDANQRRSISIAAEQFYRTFHSWRVANPSSDRGAQREMWNAMENVARALSAI